MPGLDDLLLKVKNRKQVMIVTPIVVGVFLGWSMVLKPTLSGLGKVRSQKSDLSSKVAVFDDIMSWHQKLSSYKVHLAPIEDKAKMIEDLGTAATASGLSVSSITPDEKKDVGTYLERVSVHIEADGTYHELGQFVSHVENMQTFTKIMGINISSPAGSGGGDPDVAVPVRRGGKAGGKSYKISIVVGLFYAHKDTL